MAECTRMCPRLLVPIWLDNVAECNRTNPSKHAKVEQSQRLVVLAATGWRPHSMEFVVRVMTDAHVY
eukprot:1775681-Prymnesium_polylepis.1